MTKNKIYSRIAGLGFALDACFTLYYLYPVLQAGISIDVWYLDVLPVLGGFLAALSMLTEKEKLLAPGSALTLLYWIGSTVRYFLPSAALSLRLFLMMYITLNTMIAIAWLLLFFAGIQPLNRKRLGRNAGIVLLVRFIIMINSSFPFTHTLVRTLPLIFASFYLSLSAVDGIHIKAMDAEASEKLRQLQGFLKNGVITREEYEEMIKKL